MIESRHLRLVDPQNGTLPPKALDAIGGRFPASASTRESLPERMAETLLRTALGCTAAEQGIKAIAEQAISVALENAWLRNALIEQTQRCAHAEEQLQAALADLAHTMRLRAMGELVASIVHEVGQPLTSIDTSASAALRWLDRDPPEIDETRQMLTNIRRSATRAKDILQGLRAMARKAEPQFSALDLGDALREAAILIAGQLGEQGVTIALHGLDEPMRVHGDRVQLQQVVINLLTNGAESMATLEADRRLTLSCTNEEGNVVRIVVEDRGIGVAPEIASRLYEPFFTTRDTGMGMGLTIAQAIVDAHGGVLTLSPRDGGGTRASFALARLA